MTELGPKNLDMQEKGNSMLNGQHMQEVEVI